eukprot:s1416_g7.t1
MRKNAFVDENEGYKGKLDTKHAPPIPTPSRSARQLEQVLKSDFAPKGVGIQTAKGKKRAREPTADGSKSSAVKKKIPKKGSPPKSENADNPPNSFKGYDLSEAIEVLLRARAFVIKRVASEDGSSSGSSAAYRQFTWSKHGGPTNSWNVAKEAAGWPDDE